MTTLHRRRLLAHAGNLILFSGLAPAGQVLAQARIADDPYTLGVASGDPLPDGFVIWTRLAPRPNDEFGGMTRAAVVVTWEVAQDDRFARIVRSGEAIARPELAHSVHVEVDGLSPARPYWYRFRIGAGAASPVGRARTAPPAGSMPKSVRLAVAGCQNFESGYFDAWRHLSQEADIDAIFHYGDYIYEATARRAVGTADENGRVLARAHGSGEIYSLDQYRRRYSLYKSDPDLMAAHASAAFVVSFDDHEVDNNWVAEMDQDGTPPDIFMLRRMAALQAWYEHMPVRRAQLPGPAGILAHRRLDYGRLMRMHVLDTRTYRTDQLCSPGETRACRAAETPDATMLGAAQEAWLGEGLTGGHSWNLLAQQVMMMPVARRLPDGSVGVRSTDTWAGYPAARRRLIEAIETRGLTNVVVATGDAHNHYVGLVPSQGGDPSGPAAATEFLCTSISSEGDGTTDPAASTALTSLNPNLKLHNQQRGYQLFDIAADHWRTTLKVMDRVTTPGGRISTLASFVVTPDKAHLHQG